MALHSPMVGVAAKQFVAGITSNCDSAVGPHQSRHEIGWNHRRVTDRLVVLTGQLRQHVDGRRLSWELRVSSAKMRRDKFGVRSFVVSAMAGERNRESPHRRG